MKMIKEKARINLHNEIEKKKGKIFIIIINFRDFFGFVFFFRSKSYDLIVRCNLVIKKRRLSWFCLISASNVRR